MRLVRADHPRENLVLVHVDQLDEIRVLVRADQRRLLGTRVSGPLSCGEDRIEDDRADRIQDGVSPCNRAKREPRPRGPPSVVRAGVPGAIRPTPPPRPTCGEGVGRLSP